jgi:hypothetical protein
LSHIIPNGPTALLAKNYTAHNSPRKYREIKYRTTAIGEDIFSQDAVWYDDGE